MRRNKEVETEIPYGFQDTILIALNSLCESIITVIES